MFKRRMMQLLACRAPIMKGTVQVASNQKLGAGEAPPQIRGADRAANGMHYVPS